MYYNYIDMRIDAICKVVFYIILSKNKHV